VKFQSFPLFSSHPGKTSLTKVRENGREQESLVQEKR